MLRSGQFPKRYTYISVGLTAACTCDISMLAVQQAQYITQNLND